MCKGGVMMCHGRQFVGARDVVPQALHQSAWHSAGTSEIECAHAQHDQLTKKMCLCCMLEK
jgi:hypothetical protein